MATEKDADAPAIRQATAQGRLIEMVMSLVKSVDVLAERVQASHDHTGDLKDEVCTELRGIAVKLAELPGLVSATVRTEVTTVMAGRKEEVTTLRDTLTVAFKAALDEHAANEARTLKDTIEASVKAGMTAERESHSKTLEAVKDASYAFVWGNRRISHGLAWGIIGVLVFFLFELGSKAVANLTGKAIDHIPTVQVVPAKPSPEGPH